MHIRLTQLSDLPAASYINASALRDDALIASLAPYRDEYPEEYINMYVRRNKERFYTPKRVLLVAVTDEEDGEAGKVVGHVIWRRDGEDEAAKRWGEWVGGGKGGWLWHRWCAFQRSLATMSNNIVDAMDLNPSIDPKAFEEFEAVAGNSFPDSLSPEKWYLVVLTVHPSYQRRGIGQMLVKWGMDQAREENVPIALEATTKGYGLYEKLGFKIIKWVECGGLRSPAMLWEPEGYTGNTKSIEEECACEISSYAQY